MSLHPDPVLIVAFGEDENLGVGYLMSALKEAGIETGMIDFRHNNEEILADISRQNPIVVGFSLIFEVYIDEFAQLIRFLRQNGINCHFTAGGYYASLHSEDLFGLMPGLDSIVRFEGEYTLPELVNCLRTNTDWRSIRNLAFRDNSRIIMTTLRSLETDLDNFPFPVRRKPAEYAMGKKYTAILAGRGCIYDCAFCNTREFYRQGGGPLKRIRKPELVVSEMFQMYTEQRCSVFLFQDDDFPVRKPGGDTWVKSFCTELKRKGLAGNVIWKINCRPDEIDRDTFRLMKQHGLFLVFIGLEDGTDEGLVSLNKRMTVESGLQGVDILRNLDLDFDFGFMLFQPESTFISLRENLNYMERICSYGYSPITFLKLMPYFDTRVEKDLREQGRLKGNPGKLDYNFRTESLDACWTAVGECFAEWLWGRVGVVNLAKWIRNYLAVGYFFWGPDSAIDEYLRYYRNTVVRANLFLAASMTEMFDYYESGNYLKDEGKQKERIRTSAESMNKLLSESMKKILKNLQE
ncbi:MAG: B12-binding domain-containing radical SAM protein [Bacteroidales bacterium]|nr:B12-binding domain-containing radical SAM protein [Bacteroidales bacterium]